MRPPSPPLTWLICPDCWTVNAAFYRLHYRLETHMLGCGHCPFKMTGEYLHSMFGLQPTA